VVPGSGRITRHTGTTPVTLGLVADGWADITEGLRASEVVRLPS
jgi:hypothetical protein